MNNTIKASRSLCASDLLQLIKGEILVLKIYPFEDENTCIRWQNSLNTRTKLNRYSNALDVPVNRLGMTLFETENKPEKITQYLNVGKKTRSTVQQIFGRKNPLDQLINKLNSSWNAGCSIQKLKNKTMNPGIIRSFESAPNGGLPPHVDSLLKDLPDHNEFNNLQCQLAANLYFEIPNQGGELEIWDYAPQANELKKLYTGNYDFIDPNKIPAKSVKITPKKGELIVFRSSCIHSVRGSQGGFRSAASCFIGYYGETKPITVWA